MSESKKFSAVPTASDMTGKSVLLTDDSGEVSKITPLNLKLTSIRGKETRGSTITIEEFVDKYIANANVLDCFSDVEFDNASTWYIQISDSLTINIQHFIIVLAKKVRNLSQTWGHISLLFFPASSQVAKMYHVVLSTGSSTSVIKRVYRLNFEQVT
ncbi:MAG: hypothetical protein K2G69_04380 [Muribaculaceae bacterium]|nr:hypothetical protein [Muribaculaceae bacterium]